MRALPTLAASLAAVLLAAASARAQASAAHVRPAPAAVTARDGVVVYPFRVSVHLGDREFRHRMYHLPPYAQTEAYELDISPGGVTLKTVSLAGQEYGMRSLAQMLAVSDTIRCCVITDYPSEEHRPAFLSLPPEGISEEAARFRVDAAASDKKNVLVVSGGSLPESVRQYAENKLISIRYE